MSEGKKTAHCCYIENKNGRRDTHFPKTFFTILHSTSLALMFTSNAKQNIISMLPR
jgi:hypothetical protein